MLAKPKYGWCNIMIGQYKIGCASYLTDVPTYLLDVFNQYLSEENRLGFTIEFDAGRGECHPITYVSDWKNSYKQNWMVNHGGG